VGTHRAREYRVLKLSTLVAFALLLAANTADAALRTGACLAQKQTAWGDLRKCQATELAKALKGKVADLTKCQTKFQVKLAKISGKATKVAIACRYGDNGDGTVTDYDTGLQWEQKDNLDGSPNFADPHDADNYYTWSSSGTDPDGTVFTDFLAELNDCVDNGTVPPTGVTGGFADHCDWRLPTIMELLTIVDLSAPGCGSGSPCIDATALGPTVASAYWASTTFANSPDGAWVVFFGSGNDGGGSKNGTVDVRAVRGGL
jgi:hypothetical protein